MCYHTPEITALRIGTILMAYQWGHFTQAEAMRLIAALIRGN